MQVMLPEYQAPARSARLSHVGVTTFERLDQRHLHPLPEHPETHLSLPGIEPGLPASQYSSKELFEKLAIRNPYRIVGKEGMTKNKWENKWKNLRCFFL